MALVNSTCDETDTRVHTVETNRRDIKQQQRRQHVKQQQQELIKCPQKRQQRESGANREVFFYRVTKCVTEEQLENDSSDTAFTQSNQHPTGCKLCQQNLPYQSLPPCRSFLSCRSNFPRGWQSEIYFWRETSSRIDQLTN